MITPKEAYDLFKDQYPKAYVPLISDFGDYYMVNIAGSDEDYKIDKKTGAISEMSFLEYMAKIKEIGDDDDAYPEYSFE